MGDDSPSHSNSNPHLDISLGQFSRRRRGLQGRPETVGNQMAQFPRILQVDKWLKNLASSGQSVRCLDHAHVVESLGLSSTCMKCDWNTSEVREVGRCPVQIVRSLKIEK